MKRNLIIVSVLIALVAIFGFLFKSLNNRPNILPTELKGKPLPAFSANQLSEPGAITTILTQQDIKGPALINVWATWCINCEAEHAMLNTLKEQGITIYGINYKDEPAKAHAWLMRLGNPYFFNVSDVAGTVGIELGVYGAPETFFLDDQNHIRYRHVGEITTQNWEQSLKKIYDSLFTSKTDIEGEKP